MKPYAKVHDDWVDGPAPTTPVYAADMEQIEEGIYVNSTAVPLKAKMNPDPDSVYVSPNGITGTGKFGSPAGDGSRDLVISADDFHPTREIGTIMIARKFVDAAGVVTVPAVVPSL